MYQDKYGLCANKYIKPNHLVNTSNVLRILDQYKINYVCYDDSHLIKINISDLDIPFDIVKRIFKILSFEAQYNHIEKNKIILEISKDMILSNKFLILLNLLKLTKVLHYFKIKIKKDNEFILDNEFKNRLAYIIENYQGLNIK